MFTRISSVRTAGIAATIAVALIPSLRAQSISFAPVASSVLEQRLKQVAEGNQERGQTLKKLFVEAGCDHVTEQPVKGAATPNVVCTLPGTENATVIVGAHYDKPSKGDGVIDDWSGAALLPSLYESLNKNPRRITFVFVGFTDQQKGLRGSQAYARELKKDSAKAMVNINSVGLSPAKIWTAQSDKELVGGIARVAQALKIQVTAMDLEEGTSADSRPFRDKRIPTIDIHSLSAATISIPGSDKDKAELIQMEDYGNTYRLISGYLAFLDATLDKPAAAPAK
jgi:acetylornithine deacetylase/succinyl-diaminopimelate desuccinylase-like protein